MTEHAHQAQWTPGPWGIEQTRDMLWVGPMRADGHKVDSVVVGLNIDRELTPVAALRQLYHARLIAAAPDLASELAALVTAVRFADPPRMFNGVLCHEARVPVAFVEGAEAALARAHTGPAS